MWLGDRCEGLVEWRELMGRSAAQTHPGSPCLLPLRLLIGFTTLPCCSHTNAGTLAWYVKEEGEKSPPKKQRVTRRHTHTVSKPIQRLTPLLPFDPSLLYSPPKREKKTTNLLCFRVGPQPVHTAELGSRTIWCGMCMYVNKGRGR